MIAFFLKLFSKRQRITAAKRRPKKRGYSAKRWTKEELSRLNNLAKSGVSADAMTHSFPGRTLGAITSQLWRIERESMK